MEDRNTDPRILVLIWATIEYVKAHELPTNPFVKGFGISESVEEAYKNLVESLKDCKDYFPEVQEMIEAFAENHSEERTSEPTENPS